MSKDNKQNGEGWPAPGQLEVDRWGYAHRWPVKGEVLALRFCDASMRSPYNIKFKWPEEGYVECEEWNPDTICGDGLFGFLWGQTSCWGGVTSLIFEQGKWVVVAVAEEEVVLFPDSSKIKFPRGRVVCAGNRRDATQFLARYVGDRPFIGRIIELGDNEELEAVNFPVDVIGGHRNKVEVGCKSSVRLGDGCSVKGEDRCSVVMGSKGNFVGGFSHNIICENSNKISGDSGNLVSCGFRITWT